MPTFFEIWFGHEPWFSQKSPRRAGSLSADAVLANIDEQMKRNRDALQKEAERRIGTPCVPDPIVDGFRNPETGAVVYVDRLSVHHGTPRLEMSEEEFQEAMANVENPRDLGECVRAVISFQKKRD